MSKRRTSWRLDVSRDLPRLAGLVVPNHANWIDQGWRLCGSTALWRRRDGSFTARVVYRRVDESVVFTVRGVRWAS
jgi:hypothetical protein